mgnify:CR=1 FL=1
MVQTRKKRKVEDSITYKEEVLFNSDTLSKVISYLPSVDLLNLALTSKRFGVSTNNNHSEVFTPKKWAKYPMWIFILNKSI